MEARWDSWKTKRLTTAEQQHEGTPELASVDSRGLLLHGMLYSQTVMEVQLVRESLQDTHNELKLAHGFGTVIYSHIKDPEKFLTEDMCKYLCVQSICSQILQHMSVWYLFHSQMFVGIVLLSHALFLFTLSKNIQHVIFGLQIPMHVVLILTHLGSLFNIQHPYLTQTWLILQSSKKVQIIFSHIDVKMSLFTQLMLDHILRI